MSRISIHSEISKLLFPVIASRPACFWKFDFSGRLSLLKDPSSALVTQGGLPTTKSGSGIVRQHRGPIGGEKIAVDKLHLALVAPAAQLPSEARKICGIDVQSNRRGAGRKLLQCRQQEVALSAGWLDDRGGTRTSTSAASRKPHRQAALASGNPRTQSAVSIWPRDNLQNPFQLSGLFDYRLILEPPLKGVRQREGNQRNELRVARSGVARNGPNEPSRVVRLEKRGSMKPRSDGAES